MSGRQKWKWREERRPGFASGNTRKNSTQVHCVSITFLLAFEWTRKTLKLLAVKAEVKFPTLRNQPRRVDRRHRIVPRRVVGRNLPGKRLPVLGNSNPLAKARGEFYCVTSEWIDSLNGIAPNFAAQARTR